jgi:competence protein ComEC
LFSFFIIGFLVASIWFVYIINDYIDGKQILTEFYNNNIKAEGVIIKPRFKDIRKTKYIIELKRIFLKNRDIALKKNIKISTYSNLYPTYDYGDKVYISCLLKNTKTEQINDAFKKEFSLTKYYFLKGIHGTCIYPDIKKIGHLKTLSELFVKSKHKIDYRIKEILPWDQASIIIAILTGDKSGIRPEILQLIRQAGLGHLIVISGMHILIIAQILSGILLLIGISKKNKVFLVLTMLFIYIGFIGFPASALRAFIMLGISLLSPLFSRQCSGIRSLFLTAGIMLLLNPK